MIPVTHYFSHFQALGGVQSLLRRHLERDDCWELDTQVVAFFDAVQVSDSKVRGLGLSWRSTVRSARQRFLAQGRGPGDRLAVYHNLWGVPFFADLDRAQRRMGVLHVYPHVLGDCLSANAGLVDGVLCVSQPLKAQVHRLLPELDDFRVAILPLPIQRCPLAPQREPLQNRPIVIGYNGRLVKTQKRIDRLPKLTGVLDQAGLNYRLELLGDGPAQAWLEEQWRGNLRVRFHGRQSGDGYWKVLANWDAIVFTSDFEGLPLGLLEAMSAGVLPIYPCIGSGGDSYAASVNPEFLYDPDDFQRVAKVMANLTAAKESEIESWRARGRELAESHTGDAYHEVFSSFVRRIHEAPRISRLSFAPRPHYFTDYWPFAVLSRVYLRGFFRPTRAYPNPA